MTRAGVREQVAAHYRAERLAIMTADGDVTEAEATAVLDCEDGAELRRVLGEPACICGAHGGSQ